MRQLSVFTFLIAVVVAGPTRSVGPTSSRIVQVKLPFADTTVSYVERSGGMTVRLTAGEASVEGRRLYIGNGEIALELTAHGSQGVYLQGETKIPSGTKWEKTKILRARPGFLWSEKLPPGSIYVELPAIRFRLPEKKGAK